jgi:hypothetical protein
MPKRRTAESPYAKAVADADARIQDVERHRCHYEIDGMRCTAAGTMCEGAVWDPNVKDPSRRWLCSAHYKLRGDHLGSREVIADLAKHPPKPPENWREKMLNEHGLGILQTAWRDMDEEERRTVIAQAIRKGRNFVRSVIARPEKPPGPTVHIDPRERERQVEAAYRAMTPGQRAEYDRGAA